MNDAQTRRRFAHDLTVGIAGAATIAVPITASAAEPDEPAPAERLLAILQERFPDRLADESWKQVRGKIENQLRAAGELRKFALTNADEPATVFVVSRTR
jgi:hypothetical protein